MKKVLLLLLFFCNSLYSQSLSYFQSADNQIDYFKSNLSELKDENGNIIYSSFMLDSLVLMGESTVNYFGGSVSSVGDVNGDGYSDVIVGASGWNSNTGRAYIFYGGLIMNNIADLTFTGKAVDTQFGLSVSSACDVNGDGYSDVIVGAREYNTGLGITFLYFGGVIKDTIVDLVLSGGLNSLSTAGDVNGDGYSDVIVGAYSDTGKAFIYFGGNSMDNIADVIMKGESRSNLFGYSVSTSGDVNGDGYSDVIVGAYGNNINGENSGKAYIYYGGSSMDNVADVIMNGETDHNYFGISCSYAGDVNGDGFSDVIVGAHGYNDYTGRAYIYYGDSTMNNVADVILNGETSQNWFGMSVTSAGDVNGDGYSDVIVGAVRYINFTGRVYIFYGGSSMDNIQDAILTGDIINNWFGHSVSNAGDLNSDGYSDIIIGQKYFNSSIGRAVIYNSLLPKPELIFPTNNSINNPTSINFKWKKVNSTSYYLLSISTDSLFNNIVVKDTIYTDTSKLVSGFQKNKKYFWIINAKDTSGNIRNSTIWNFTIIPPIYLNVKLLFEGMYSPFYNQLIRKDSITVYLHQSNPPFNILDSAKAIIDTLIFTGFFNFYNASTGNYYISVKHFNSIETWSKSGGEYLATDGIFYNYDFTVSNTQAYGNNLKLKGSKYCLYSGDVNQDGYITLFDVIPIYNDAVNFLSGRYLLTDLNGDGIVDLTDVTLCYNNSTNFIRVRQP